MALARRAWPDALAALIVAAAVFAFFGHAFLNYDSFYALVWGDDLAHGRTPQFDAPVAPTPHPLANLLGLILSPLGDTARETAFLVIVLIAVGFLVVGIFRLGQELFSTPVGVLAALIVATRVPLLNYGVRGYVDLMMLAFVIWAAVLEARRPRSGAAVMVLLGLAGLLRPEIWLFAAVYWLWCFPARDWNGRIKLAALAAAAPVLWLASDWAITGDPLWSLNGTTDLAAELGRKTGLANVPRVMPRRLGEIVRLEYLIASLIGVAAGLALMRRKTLLPLAIAVLNGIAFIVFGIAGLSLLGRYLFLASTMIALFAALAALGWTALPRGAKYRRRWAAGGALLIVGFLVLTPWQVDRLIDLRTDIADRDRVAADLHRIAEQPAVAQAAKACRPLYVPNHRPVPDLALWTDTRPKDIVAVPVDPNPDGIYIGPATPGSAELSVLDPRDPKPLGTRVPAPGDGPANWDRELGRNRSWVAFSAGCSG
jgi:Dolichyl-phosphate-mannose-protein mannosyltransferase